MTEPTSSTASNHGSIDKGTNDGYVFREREVNARKNPTKLFRLIMLRQFKTAVERLQHHADEASVWVCIIKKKKDSRKEYYTARHLPIHIACLMIKPNMPNLLLLIKKLIEVYPDGVKKTDNGGKLPIHIAVWKAAPLPIIVKMLRLNPTSLDQKSKEEKKPLEYDSNSKIKNQKDMVNQLNERIRVEKEKMHKEKSKETPPKRTTSLSRPNSISTRERISVSSENNYTAEPTTTGYHDNSEEIDELKTELKHVTRMLVAETLENNVLRKKMSTETENHMFRKSQLVENNEVLLEENEKLKAEMINRMSSISLLRTSHSFSLSSKKDDNNKEEMKDKSEAMIDEGDDKTNDNMTMSIVEDESHLPLKTQDIDTSKQISIDNNNDILKEAFDNNNSISQRASNLLSALSSDINYYGYEAYMQYYSELEHAMHGLSDGEKCEQIISLVKNAEALKKDVWRLKRLVGSYCQWLKDIQMEIVDPLPMWQHGVEKVLAAEVMNELRQLFAGTVALDVPVQLYISCMTYDDTFEDTDEYWD